jgi:hypothetical protein
MSRKERRAAAARGHWLPEDVGRAPERFSYPKRPITLAVNVPVAKLTSKQAVADIVRQYTEIAGAVPFDWDYMPLKNGVVFVMWFGLDSWEAALAAKAKFGDVDTVISDEAEEIELLRREFEKAEQAGDRPTFDGGDGLGEMYWRDHPSFKELRSEVVH